MTVEDIEAIKRYVEAKMAEAVASARGETLPEYVVSDAEQLLDSMADER